MAMRRKQFKTDTSAGNDDVILVDINDQQFKCRPHVPGITLLNFMSLMDMDHPHLAGGALRDILGDALHPSEFERFNQYISNPENNVDLETLTEIASWLVEQYTGNPMPAPPQSSNGSVQNGNGLVAVPSEPVADSETSTVENSTP